jgi:hypothetical protein
MNADAGSSPKYNLSLVAALILEEAVELHPRHLTARELSLRIVIDPDDSREIETATGAIEDLREAGLLSHRNDDEVVEPTRAALRAVTLLAR